MSAPAGGGFEAWSFPVPVRPGGFTALRSEHAALGVEVALDRVQPFAIERAEGEHLYADLQSPAWGGPLLRLGSGRSGTYRGAYLKGVGRTPLAGNWCADDDWYHGSGHLFPTAAARELLATAYLRARGLGDLLVPCEGVLLRPLPPALATALQASLGPARAELAPIDGALQAISVKPAGFARMTNFLWLLTRIQGLGAEWQGVAVALEHYASGRAVSPDRCTPTTVAAALREAAARALRAFAAYARVGLAWQSTSNNFALDGRFVDLEVPYFAGRPFIGAVAVAAPSRLAGLEAIDAAVELKLGLVRLSQRVRELVDLPLVWPAPERRFMRALADAIAEVAHDEALFGADAVLAPIEATLGALPHAPADLGDVLRRSYHMAWQVRRASTLSAVAPLTPAPHTFHRVEPLVHQRLWLPAGAYREEEWEDARFMNARFAEVEAATDVDDALARLAAAERAIAQRFGGDAPC